MGMLKKVVALAIIEKKFTISRKNCIKPGFPVLGEFQFFW
jgi:hypothetical protein